MRKISYVSRIIILAVFLLLIAGCGDFWSTGTETKNTDTTTPSVSSRTPSSGATGVSVNTEINVIFSEDVFLDGFSVSGVSGSYSASLGSASFKPDRRLDYSTTYTATVKNVRDGNGNSLGDTSWSFTTTSPSFNFYTTPDSHNSDVGKYNSIDLYSNKKYIGYQNSSDCSLLIISTTDGTSFDGPYTIESPSQSGECFGKDSVMTIDNSGTIHVVYLHERTQLTETVGTGNGFFVQFTATLTNTPIKKGTISILHNGSQIGQDDGSGKITGTNIDSNNSTIDYSTGSLVLQYTTAPGAGVAITTTYTPTDEVKYAYASTSDISGGWQKTTIYQFSDTTDTTIYADITTDSNNKVHISFYDQENTALRYATNKNGSWQTEIADDGASEDNPGKYTSIEVDSSGTVHISYYDYHSSVGNGNLKYAKGSLGSWSTYTLDSTGDIGKYSSLALYNGKPYITYFDTTNSQIKLITNNTSSGDWNAQTLVSSITERMCPLIIESNGIMHMSYILNDALYYLSKSWGLVTNSIESGIGSGNYTSIAIDSNGKAYISYYDATDQDLKYAHQTN